MANLGFGTQKDMYDPNNPDHVAAAKGLASGMADMINSGNNVGAQALYNQKQQQFGFTDAEFSPYAHYQNDPNQQAFSADQIAKWKGATPQTPTGAAQATSMGYTPTTVNLSDQYSSMGASDPSQANKQLLSGQVNNQYLDAQAQNIQTRLNRNLQENIMPGIGQGAEAAGQYGGSRQGIAQGKAIADTQDNYAGQMANLYGTANENAQNRMSSAAATQSGLGAQTGIANAGYQNQASQFGANAANTANMFNAGQANSYNLGMTNNATNYDLGLRSNDLGYANLDSNIAQNNFGNQLNSAQFGLNAYNAVNNANTAGVNAATTLQNTPYSNWSNFNTAANNVGQGLASGTTSQNASGNPYTGALAGLNLGLGYLKQA